MRSLCERLEAWEGRQPGQVFGTCRWRRTGRCGRLWKGKGSSGSEEEVKVTVEAVHVALRGGVNGVDVPSQCASPLAPRPSPSEH
ncbi:hypothetical protein E2C01_054600 [Portunus trituberculatus]|uniref:Uncharacterized protein n=1 Tax=Portunus trituberculatus TaxID=210409 RepID=A0A5B7GKA1_PORTR|nr:hypothetical protein [Portunus trituberculatus]